jgi:hypothetical protein
MALGSEQVRAERPQPGAYNLQVTGDGLQLAAGSGHSKETDE